MTKITIYGSKEQAERSIQTQTNIGWSVVGFTPVIDGNRRDGYSYHVLFQKLRNRGRSRGLPTDF